MKKSFLRPKQTLVLLLKSSCESSHCVLTPLKNTHLVNHAAGAVHAIPHASPATVVRTSPFGTHLVNHAAGAVHAIPHHTALPQQTFLRLVLFWFIFIVL